MNKTKITNAITHIVITIVAAMLFRVTLIIFGIGLELRNKATIIFIIIFSILNITIIAKQVEGNPEFKTIKIIAITTVIIIVVITIITAISNVLWLHLPWY